MDDYSIHGIDVSHHQQTIDWQKVTQEKIDFAFIKATEGTDHQDTLFSKHWKELQNSKITRGAYHFFSPFSSAKGQAQNFISTVKLKEGDLPPVLDVEIEGKLDEASLRKSVFEWLQIIEVHYKVKPILYTNQKFYMRFFTGGKFDKYPLWIARYRSKTPPFIPFGQKWTFWQYGACGHLNGINGCVDFNVFHGEGAAFDKLLVQSPLTQNKSL